MFAPRKPDVPVHPPAVNDEDHMEFVQLHVMLKNSESIKSIEAEVGRYQFDLLLVAETSRGEQELLMVTGFS